jgi:hypothetical protein
MAHAARRRGPLTRVTLARRPARPAAAPPLRVAITMVAWSCEDNSPSGLPHSAVCAAGYPGRVTPPGAGRSQCASAACQCASHRWPIGSSSSAIGAAAAPFLGVCGSYICRRQRRRVLRIPHSCSINPQLEHCRRGKGGAIMCRRHSPAQFRHGQAVVTARLRWPAPISGSKS